MITRLATLQGCLRPVRVVSGSMADALWGPHYAIRCRDCDFVFRCGVEYLPTNSLTVCPNCGYPDNPVDSRRFAQGRRVLIDRWLRTFRSPHPWEMIALRTPDDEEKWTVKRIVAGGEGRVAIRDGNIYVDGQIQRKNLAQLRNVRILVHDDRHRPSFESTGPPRWRGAHNATRWEPTTSGYRFTRRNEVDGEDGTLAVDWLEYVQWTCWPNANPADRRMLPVSILDHYGYNQNLSRGSLHPVPDIMLTCRLEAAGTGRVLIRLSNRTDNFDVELEPASQRCSLRRNDRFLAEQIRLGFRQPWTLEMALCDHRVLAAVNGVTIFAYPYHPSDAPRDDDTSRISVGAAGVDVRFLEPRIHRDIYYLGPGGITPWEAPQPLRKNQWFVLGDNVPAAQDSRIWSAIDGKSILGPVIVWGRGRR
jgi:hypothetical protein